MNNFNSVWDFDLIWNKCKYFAQKSLSEERESPMFPFWSALTLEFLGRSVLAKIHPVLLADPREGDNILYVFGLSKIQGPPKSIVAKTVFDRCSKIIPEFTKKELESCLKLIERRNEELHSGAAAFVSFATKLWLLEYYRSCKILLRYLEFELNDLFGKEEASAAEEMIQEVDNELIKLVNKRIHDKKLYFDSLSEGEKSELSLSGNATATLSVRSSQKLEECICCKSRGILSGKIISSSEERLIDSEIVYEKVILPTSFICYTCDFQLNSHQELVIAGYGGQFTEKETWGPVEYHNIDPYEIMADGYDGDYGND